GKSRKAMNVPARKKSAARKKSMHEGSVRKETRRQTAIGSSAYRNKRGNDTNAIYALEDNNPAKRPSRKSTRGSSNRIKPDSNLRRRQTRKVRSPQSRSQMRGG